MVRPDALVGIAATRLRYLGKINEVVIDNWAFTLHYRLATMTLFLVSAFVICNQLFGDPISCLKTSDVDPRIIDSYCWIEGTFTLPKALLREIDMEQSNYTSLIAAPGVDKSIPSKDERIVHNYYYWVSLMLFFQACGFFFPHLLWKSWEGGQLRFLIKDLNKCVLSDLDKKDRAEKIVSFIQQRFGYYDRFAFKFMLCEAINLIHVLFQIKLTDIFLKGEFLRYGYNILTLTKNDVNPTNRVFPKMAKCTFRRFGSSGDVQSYDHLCLLPLNILNEKIYLFIWFLFGLLLIVSTFALIYRLFVMLFPPFRHCLMRIYNYQVNKNLINSILHRCSYGDWFLLYLLSRNIDQIYYEDILSMLGDRLENQLSYNYNQASTLQKR